MTASDPLRRFQAKCVAAGDCIVWTGRTGVKGHGLFDVRPLDGVGRSRPVQAHRWIYEHLIGPIPDGAAVHHTCENPPCVNVEHLMPVSAWEHKREHRSDLCPTCGAAWDASNTYVHSLTGYRRCRRCHARRARERKRAMSKGRPPLQPCGTNAAYARHRKKGERPCDECLEARARYIRAWRSSQP